MVMEARSCQSSDSRFQDSSRIAILRICAPEGSFAIFYSKLPLILLLLPLLNLPHHVHLLISL